MSGRGVWTKKSEVFGLAGRNEQYKAKACVPDDVRGFENLRLGEDRQKDILVKVDASVGEFSEGSLLLEFGGLFGILHKISLSVFQSRLFGIVPLLTYEASAMMASWRQCACHLSGMFEKEGIGKGLEYVLKW